MDNLRIYNAGREVPDTAKSPIQAGRLKGMTDISPMWRIKRLTEIFGPCGIGWWYEVVSKHIEFDEVTKQKAAFVDIQLYYVENGEVSKPVFGTGGASFVAQERSGPYMSDECFKMALTDAISVAAKALGIGADVYWGKDTTKYDRAPEQPAKPTQAKTPPVFNCERCGSALTSYANDSGEKVSITRHARASQERFGRVLCLNCIRKVKEQQEIEASCNEVAG